MDAGSETNPSAADAGTHSVEALQAALEAERARAREIDHRAKNSLQLVASLLLLLSRRSAEAETRKGLAAMYQRISAIAAVHRNLLDSERPDRCDLTQLIREHVEALAKTHGEGAQVRLELEPVEVAAAAASPLALIVNELTLNALTHTRAGGHAPTVTVRLCKRGAGFAVEVQDDGPGPAAVKDGGFGLHVVKLLSQQLSAAFELKDAQPGLRAVVTTS
jgi:two-component sensor histidine kinase